MTGEESPTGAVPRLTIEGVSKSFEAIHALRDVSFELAPGEIHALVGENGAGKSTLVGIITGLREPDTGRVLLNGTEVGFHNPLEARAQVGLGDDFVFNLGAAAGMVGGSLLLNSIRGMMGGGQQTFGDTAGRSGGVEDRRPWGDQAGGGDLAKDAGIDDIGRSGERDSGSRQGMYDEQSSNQDYASNEDYGDEDDMDHDDGFDDGDSDYT